METFVTVIAGVAIGCIFCGFFGMQGMKFDTMIIVGASIQACLLVGFGMALRNK